MNFGIDEKGHYLGNTGGHSMFDKFNQHWKTHLDQGIITNEEYINTTFAQHYRTVDEFCAPFNDKTSKISKTHRIYKNAKIKMSPISKIMKPTVASHLQKLVTQDLNFLTTFSAKLTSCVWEIFFCDPSRSKV